MSGRLPTGRSRQPGNQPSSAPTASTESDPDRRCNALTTTDGSTPGRAIEPDLHRLRIPGTGHVQQGAHVGGRHEQRTDETGIRGLAVPTMALDGHVEGRVPGREDGGVVDEPCEQGGGRR